MTYDHCPRCGCSDIDAIRHTSWNSTIYRCEDCGYECEIDDDMFGYNTSWGWQDAVEED